ncbi:hypothetical protein [Tahibacter caeni]|uniref:hypothetical protein n=1 Tax=Tahibacter caeni TaxID=1453545 RepID=UPI002148E980|nr:hypothetical protein [Tahibacter caeni]
MLEITRESLQQRYADLVDAELLRRLRADALTDLAREVALAELAQRGISAETALAAAAVAEPAVDAELDFPADEFERNPYQAPRGPVSAGAPSSAQQTPVDWIWWGYAVYIAALVALGVYRWVTLRQGLAMGGVLLVNAWALAGLVGWRLRRRWLHSSVWAACLAINAALGCIGARELARVAATAPPELVYSTATYQAVGNLLLGLPLLWGLFRYGFLSAPIWRRPAAA